jgi:hypothetical protein
MVEFGFATEGSSIVAAFPEQIKGCTKAAAKSNLAFWRTSKLLNN